jgi:hypothetical protein
MSGIWTKSKRDVLTDVGGAGNDAGMTDQTNSPERLDDLLKGAEEIAAFLGRGWTANGVYQARFRKQLPLRKGNGMRLYAFKSEIIAHLRRDESLTNITHAA